MGKKSLPTIAAITGIDLGLLRELEDTPFCFISVRKQNYMPIYIPDSVLSELSVEKNMDDVFDDRKKLDAMISLVDEVSHFLHARGYRETFGKNPRSPLLELIACIDKVNVFEYLSLKTRGRNLSPEEYSNILPAVAPSGLDREIYGNTPATYTIGHRLGVQLIEYLNNLHRNNNQEDADILLKQLHD